MFTQKKSDRINFRSGNGGRVLQNPPGVRRCWSRAWSHDCLSHGIDNMADPVMLWIFGVQLLMFVQVVVTFMHVRQRIYDTMRFGARSAMVSVLRSGIDVRKRQRSHSEISRVEPLSDLPNRLFSVYLSDLAIRFSVFRQTLSDITVDRSKVKSDKLLCVNTA